MGFLSSETCFASNLSGIIECLSFLWINAKVLIFNVFMMLFLVSFTKYFLYLNLQF